MNIVIDAFGGDNAPLEVIKGSIDAQKDFGVDVTLVGDEEKIKKCAQENKKRKRRLRFVFCYRKKQYLHFIFF